MIEPFILIGHEIFGCFDETVPKENKTQKEKNDTEWSAKQTNLSIANDIIFVYLANLPHLLNHRINWIKL